MTDQTEPVDGPFGDEDLSELKEYRDRLAPLGVLDDLSPDQQFGLSDWVCVFDELHRRYEGPEGEAEYLQIMKAFRQRTPADVKRLEKKLDKVRDAWGDFQREVTRVDDHGNVHLAYMVRMRRVRVPGSDLHFEPMLSNVTHALDRVEIPSEDATIPQTESPVDAARDLRDKATLAVYRFFANSCQFASSEAEVRVAKIGNALWGWNVAYREKSDGADGWKGSDAIRQRLKRAESDTDN